MPDKEFKLMVIKMLTGPERRVEELSEDFNKEKEYIRKNRSDLKITKIGGNQQ